MNPQTDPTTEGTQAQTNPTQDQNTQVSQTMPNVPAGLDPTAYILTKAIALQEGGGQILAPDHPSGDFPDAPAGTAGGTYQFTPDTWKANAQEVLGNANAPMTDANQNQVAYTKIKQWLDAGNSPAQVASMWNAGPGAPDAWKPGTVQAHGDTPQYVANVQKYAEQLWNGQNPGATSPGSTSNPQDSGYGYVTPPPAQPIITPPPATPTLGVPGSNDPTLGDQLGGTGIVKDAEDIGGSLFPILPDIINDVQGKSDKDALQQVGDAGMSALWFLPFGDIAEGAGLGLEALGAGADFSKAAGVIGTGLGTGYASDVASNLSQNKTGAAAAAPGWGTVIGGGLSAAGLAGGALYNKFLGQQNAVDKVQQIWEDAAGSTKSGINNMSSTAAKGLDPNPEFLANAGILPETSDVNGRLVFNTGPDSAAQQTLDDRISALSELRDKSLDSGPSTAFTSDIGNGPQTTGAPPVVNFEDLRQQMLTQAGQDFSGTAKDAAEKQINTEMDALKADPKYSINENGDLSASQTSRIKTYLQGRANLDRPTQGLSAQIFDTMQGTAKKAVEDAAEASGNPDVKAVNKLIQQHYDAQKFLNKINGQTIKGGRLGTYVKEGVGAAIGGGIGTVFGGGPIGGAIGTIAGYKGGEIVSNLMQKLAAGGPMTAATFGRMATEEPDVVQHLLQYIGDDGKVIKSIAPRVKPTGASAGGRVIQALKYTPGSRVFRGMSRPSYIFGAKP